MAKKEKTKVYRNAQNRDNHQSRFFKIITYIKQYEHKIKKNRELSILLLFCFLLLVSHLVYVAKTFQFPHEDEHVYMEAALQYRSILLHPSGNTYSQILKVIPDRQPLYPLILSFVLIVFQPHDFYKASLITNGFFYIGSIIGIYFLAKEFLSKKGSLLAGFLFAVYGFPLFYLHFVYEETAATMFTVFALLFLARSNYLTNRRDVVLSGLFVALGSLTRWVVPIFLLGPLVYTVFFSFVEIIKKRRLEKNLVINWTLFIFAAVGIPCVLYYIPNFQSFYKYVTGTSKLATVWVTQYSNFYPDMRNSFSIRSIMFYFNILSEQTVYLFLLFCVGFVVSVLRYKKYSFLLLGFIVSYLIFTFFSVLKMDRYIVPIYPYMAILSVTPFDLIKNRITRNLVYSCIIIIGILSFLGGSWGIGPLGKRGLQDIVLPSFIHHPRRIYLTSMVWPPRQDEFQADTIVAAVRADQIRRGLAYVHVLNTYTYTPLELDNGLPSLMHYVTTEAMQETHLRVMNEYDYQELMKRLMSADYIIIKDKHPVPASQYSPEAYDKMVQVFNKAMEQPNAHLPPGFSLLQSISIPAYKRRLYIYKKNRTITKDEWKTFMKQLSTTDPTHAEKIDEVVNSL